MKSTKKLAKLFDPDEISGEISSAILRDLEEIDIEYAISSKEVFSEYITSAKKAILKKYKSSDQCDLSIPTLDAFLSNCARLREFSFSPPNVSRIPINASLETRALLRARAFVSAVLGPFDVEEWFLECKHGPGSTIGTRFATCNPEDKWSYPMTVTHSSLPIFEEYLEFDKDLSNCIESFNKFSTKPKYNFVVGSRMTTVPKDDKKDRLIAVEPTVNMFLQQGLMAMMENRLSEIGHDLSTTPLRHRQWTIESSITSDLATIDFSMASDSVLSEVVNYLLPPEWFHALSLVRCSESNVKGEWVHLPMFSTMGNATTFPLETLVFLSIAYAVSFDYTSPFSVLPDFSEIKNWRWSVFGDDCILPTVYAHDFIRVARSLGFLVNEEKSFFTRDQCFRESCGVDAFDGRDIRPFYLKAPGGRTILDQLAWFNIVTNLVLKKYIQYFGQTNYVYHQSFLVLMARLLRENNHLIRIIPSYYPDDAGLKIGDDPRLFVFFKANNCRFARIYKNKHGTHKFSFLRYQYPRRDRDDWIEYCALNKAGLNPRQEKNSRDYLVRRNGRYVVSRNGITPFVNWEQLSILSN